MGKSKIYTKTGDAGKTSLVGGKRVAKTHIRLEAYGTVDELNSFLGFLICEVETEEVAKVLSFVQHKLFNVGSYLATDTETTAVRDKSIIYDKDIAVLEREIDRMDSEVPPLKQFVLPGGSEAASRAHICRTVCRRAERCIHRINEISPVDEHVLMFMNRLSDYFFMLARYKANKAGNEIFWDNTCLL
ncbi:cob(I)yrinic acid a,c-diamide adenosyltransferase [Dysgonomonas sp. 216]|uniref:cob(I)yrinic acid a,c-diamide adenosyltransferase n=1 Tax=Dysgonomonas sp. 216 TaxID=2302934 RepID=UPI0013D6B7A4|nr:cob(I)yrinic acid a,c-diamide adenosyltransferase [Dysgonomonas sp. 216]NDW18367.1 cob(I)yrinic acid a,c-diamide adenosyltransferase [Dysgonomonas sp. 216]